MGKIVVCRDIGRSNLDKLRESGHEDVTPAPRAWVMENNRGAEAVCVMMSDVVDEEFLDAAGSALKIIATFSVGHDHIDLSALKRRKVRLDYTPTVLNNAVADTTVMLVLMAMRRAGEAIALVKAGKWPSTPWSPFSLTGPSLSTPSFTIGFLGFGRISHACLTRLLAFCLPPDHPQPPRCIYTTSGPKQKQTEVDAEYTKRFGIRVKGVGLERLAEESDLVIVLCSLNEGTKGLVEKEFLGRMKSSAVLINAARGGIVDSEALADALETEQIFAAGLDVVAGEPNVFADHRLVQHERCVILPQIGSATFEARGGMAELCVRNLLEGLAGGEMPCELKFQS